MIMKILSIVGVIILLLVILFLHQMKKKRKLNGLDLYVIFSISVLVLYTIASMVIAVKANQQIDTLTTCVFAFFGGEIVTCALIKIFKLKDKTKEDEE